MFVNYLLIEWIIQFIDIEICVTVLEDKIYTLKF